MKPIIRLPVVKLSCPNGVPGCVGRATRSASYFVTESISRPYEGYRAALG
jgi:hypothetical protein